MSKAMIFVVTLELANPDRTIKYEGDAEVDFIHRNLEEKVRPFLQAFANSAPDNHYAVIKNWRDK